MRLLTLPLIFILALSVLAEEPSYPGYSGYVNDFANVITAEEETQIATLIKEVEKTTTAEMAVVTVTTIAPQTIEAYAVELFERWKIGKKGKDNGVLIILAINDRAGRIETGYGLEGALPDIVCSEISRRIMIPYFRRGEFGKGLLAGTMAVAEKIAREYGVNLKEAIAQTGNVVDHHSPAGSIFSTIFTLLLFILILGMRMGLFGFLLFGRRGYWSGGYTGTGGFGGGFGGFGGGLSGGGGASFRW